MCFKLRFKKEHTLAASVTGSQLQRSQCLVFIYNQWNLGFTYSGAMYGCINCLDSGCIIPAQRWRFNTLEQPLTFSKSYTHGRAGPKLYTTVCTVLWMAWWKSLLSVLHHCKKQTNTVGMHESNNEMVIKKLLYQTLLFPLLLLYICSPIIKKYLFIKKKHILETNKRFS